jgi:hypothetical protein
MEASVMRHSPGFGPEPDGEDECPSQSSYTEDKVQAKGEEIRFGDDQGEPKLVLS